jgi:hypothetical protein
MGGNSILPRKHGRELSQEQTRCRLQGERAMTARLQRALAAHRAHRHGPKLLLQDKEGGMKREDEIRVRGVGLASKADQQVAVHVEMRVGWMATAQGLLAEGAALEGGLEQWWLLQGMTVNQARTRVTNPEMMTVATPRKCGWA